MKLALVRGAGDVATGVALRLRKEGYAVVCTELLRPTCLRRAVSFAEAVYEGTWQVEGVEARLARGPEEALRLVEREKVAVLAPEGNALAQLSPKVLVDARMAKRNLGTHIDEAPVVIGLGPGFVAGVDCHAAIETLNGPDLGRVYLSGSPIPPTHEPCEIGGLSQGRVVRAPCAGVFYGFGRIGELVEAGEPIARCGKEPLFAPCSGVVRGIVRGGIEVRPGMKVVELDPRGDPAIPFRVAPRAERIASGVASALQLIPLGAP
ncbi:MAG: Selenium-dependent molybdenum hydroxylase system protein, YqeB family [Acetothermia bacterium 64_32]|nr:MAG: Selenium-dependent molybdenum hydroxylase system protein, YqeB family [Acetothermia bacterium 64_32]HAF69883.1 molybdenum hydroxylase [Candidatus Acetothermia bacterium]